MRNRSLLAAAAVILFSCSTDDTTRPEPGLEGGILATFLVVNEEFKVWITNESTIQQVLDLQAGLSQATIPNGPILRGSGPAEVNTPYSWHLDPAETSMAELTIEVCSARPSFVEANVDAWIEHIGQYCPWSAELVAVEDRR